jgi:5-formyltetrahydrofolate cyclo-ligase
MLRDLAKVSESQRRDVAVRIARSLLREVGAGPPRRWALFASLRSEVSLRPLFDAIRRAGGVPLMPRVRGRRLEFVAVRDWADLRPGALGVLQPFAGRGAQRLIPGDVVVLPGLAFDRMGRRLGRGQGFYDRTFATAAPTPLRIGACYDFQLVERVPHGSHDRRVDAIVTERGMIWSGSPA